MHALVTGAAGFIGSHLADALVAGGHTVRGVDLRSKRTSRFELVVDDLTTADLAPLLDGIDVVFHLAARPGVRTSWGDEFAAYMSANVLVTQRLLEAAAGTGIRRFVYASSSSVYGEAARYPTTERDRTQPASPYGITKLAGEQLCGAYAAAAGVPTVSLRLFTVYGPRQRADMAFSRLFDAALGGRPFELLGTGDHIRDFTAVSDVVAAMLAAATEDDVAAGEVLNIAGGSSTSMTDAIALVAKLVDRDVRVVHRPSAAGDVIRTGGAIERAEAVLGWMPSVGLEDGLARQLEWHRQTRRL